MTTTSDNLTVIHYTNMAKVHARKLYDSIYNDPESRVTPQERDLIEKAGKLAYAVAYALEHQMPQGTIVHFKTEYWKVTSMLSGEVNFNEAFKAYRDTRHDASRDESGAPPGV